MTIKYDTQTTLLTRRVHGITGEYRSGVSQGLENYTTFLRLHSLKNHRRNEAKLWDVGDIMSKCQRIPVVGEPEVYPFTIGNGSWQRDVAAIHGMVDVKRGMFYVTQFRFVVVFKHEIEKTLRSEFKIDGFNARRYAQELSA